jgi:hypothetical protein
MKKTCARGHTFFKTSDCPTCPRCEGERRPTDSFLADVGAPARRALEREGITNLNKLSRYSEAELLRLHGLGPSSIPKLKRALEAEGMGFKDASGTSRSRQA